MRASLPVSAADVANDDDEDDDNDGTAMCRCCPPGKCGQTRIEAVLR